MGVTREDVIQCYRRILRREPESETAILQHLSGTPSLWDLIGKFVHSEEFRARLIEESPFSTGKPHFLAKNFSAAITYECFCHNCSYLYELASFAALQQMLFRDIEIFEWRPVKTVYTVTISVSRDSRINHEGELLLFFRSNGSRLYALSFTFVPGHVLGLQDRHAVLISRMQGLKGKFREIRLATKEMKDISPQAILVAVLAGIAQAIGIQRIAGTCATNQVSYEERRAELYQQVYDSFSLLSGR